VFEEGGLYGSRVFEGRVQSRRLSASVIWAVASNGAHLATEENHKISHSSRKILGAIAFLVFAFLLGLASDLISGRCTMGAYLYST
jgi:hypothetical protein